MRAPAPGYLSVRRRTITTTVIITANDTTSHHALNVSWDQVAVRHTVNCCGGSTFGSYTVALRAATAAVPARYGR